MGNSGGESRQVIRRFVMLLAACASLWSAPALAWWEYGHVSVAQIAEANVSPRARAAIRQLLRAEAGLGTPYCRVRTISEASYWPDCIRQEGWRWGYTFAWHYQNINVCKPYDPKANCAGGNCVTAQIERTKRVLADRKLPAAQRLEALAFLVHFVGDLHMPLHGGDNADQGGNKVKSTYGAATGFNLHAVWDGPLAERAISSAVPPLLRRYSAAEHGVYGSGSVEDWSRESWALARALVYARAYDRDPCEGGTLPEAITFTDADIEASLPDLRVQIMRAGLRLAGLLDEALGS